MANRLIHEQSPYLLQHAHNPVDWYPWGDEPFEKAKKENKPVVVSIGYAACHWCHVMERESFENEEVASFMNNHFINIKVDREEDPDVDHLYMDAVQGISGSGGWPLNVFVTPERVPFFGGTYYPPQPLYNRPSWRQLLQRMNEIWTQQQDEVKAQTDQMLQYLRQSSQIAMGNADNDLINFDTCKEMAENLLKQADKKFGGFGNAPKFPGTMSINFLLEHYHFTKNEEALSHALHSLDAMLFGGIYDQLGGGFARYSTDKQWLAPHFEKMLYDNALIVLSLCDAYMLTRREVYKNIIVETIAFVERELQDKSGIFYSAIDADSEGEEGKFYTWKWEEWKAVIDDEIVSDFFGVSEAGNWEHTNILHVSKTVEELSQKYSLPAGDIEARIAIAKEKLFVARSQRIPPLTDDKSLLSWNALMNLALSRAGIALNDPSFLQKAEHHMGLLLENFAVQDGLKHVWKNGLARIEANLDDYAYLVHALLQLTSANGNEQWILKASELCDRVLKEFLHEEGFFFYFTSHHQTDIPVRKLDLYDGATPSANAVIANNLLLLGMCMERADWIEQGSSMISQMAATSRRYPSSFSYWAILQQRFAGEMKTVVSTGIDASTFHRQLQNMFLPHCFLLTSGKEISELPVLKEKYFSGESHIFVCTQKACLAPVHSVVESLHLISEY
ncbi:MAG TPA: thioredoxin domain-containing protein [Flavipsychrobacter sp.]|nr:thioredoxin domain-containing protein [Flavipsychrobacter sp.]